MTIQDLINQFRVDVNDNTDVLQTDSDILADINECLEIIKEDYKPERIAVLDTWFTTTVAWQYSYTLPTGYINTLSLKIWNAFYLPVDFATYQKIQNQWNVLTNEWFVSYPCVYAQYNGSIYINPITVWDVVHYYNQENTDLVVWSTFPYSKWVAAVLKYYLKAKRHRKAEEYDLESISMQKYDQKIGNAMYNYITQPDRMIRETSIKMN